MIVDSFMNTISISPKLNTNYVFLLYREKSVLITKISFFIYSTNYKRMATTKDQRVESLKEAAME